MSDVASLIASNQQIATQFTAMAQQALSGLAFSVQGPELPPDPNVSALARLDSPDLGAIGEFTGRVALPPLPAAPNIAAPDVDWSHLTLDAGIQPPDPLDLDGMFNTPVPGPLTAALSISAPVIQELTVPQAPAPTLPQAPDLATDQPGALPGATGVGWDVAFQGQDPGWFDIDGQFKNWEKDRRPKVNDYVASVAQDLLTKYWPDWRQQLDAIDQRLKGAITGATPLLAEGYEQRVYSRGRDKIAAERGAADAAAAAEFAKRGYVLPPLALAGALKQNRRDGLMAVSGHLASTGVEQVKMEVQHLQFCMDLAPRLRATLTQIVISSMQTGLQIGAQAMDYAQRTVSFMVEQYNARLKAYEAAVTLYDAQARAIAARIASAMFDIEVYKVGLEALKVSSEVDMNRVRAYSERVRAAEIEVEIYAKQLEGIRTQAEIERLRQEGFRTAVTAFAEQVRAKSLEYEGYRALMSGKEATANVYSAAVRGYTAQVEAQKVVADVEVARLRAGTEVAQVQAAITNAITSLYEAETRAAGTEIEANARAFSANAEAISEQNRARIARYSAQVAQAETIARTNVALYNAHSSYNLSTAGQLIQVGESLSNIQVQAARAAGDVAAAAIGAVNSLVAQSENTELTG